MDISVGRAAAALLVGSAFMVCVVLCFADRVQFINGCLACSLYILCRGTSAPQCGSGDPVRARHVRGVLRVAAILFMLVSLASTFSLVVLPIVDGGDARLWAIPTMVVGCALRIASNSFDSDADLGRKA